SAPNVQENELRRQERLRFVDRNRGRRTLSGSVRRPRGLCDRPLSSEGRGGDKRTGGAGAFLFESCVFRNQGESGRKTCVGRSGTFEQRLFLQFRNRSERERNADRPAHDRPRKCRFVRRRFSWENGRFDLIDLFGKIPNARTPERSRPYRSEIRRYKKRPSGIRRD